MGRSKFAERRRSGYFRVSCIFLNGPRILFLYRVIERNKVILTALMLDDFIWKFRKVLLVGQEVLKI